MLIVPFLERIEGRFLFEKVILDLYISPKKRVHIVDHGRWNVAASTSLFRLSEIKECTEREYRICDTVRILPVEEPAIPIELQGGASLQDILDSTKS
jgi:hypothetical protein